MPDGTKPAWFRPAGGLAAHPFERKPSRARAYAHGKPSSTESSTLPHPGRESSVPEAYATWLLTKGLRIFGTVNTEYPLSIGQHVQVGRYLQDEWQVRCGERPTVMVPCQRNPRRDGYHSHPSIFGSETLLEVRRDEVWADLMARLSREPGIGVETVSLLVGQDRHGQFHYRQYWAEGDAGMALLSQANTARVRLEPVRNFNDALGYATRYASREVDVLEILVGDMWRTT